LSVALGILVFRERLRPLQVAALVLATVGVLVRVVMTGHFPWIALTVAFSFALYGLLRKTAPADAFLGLSIETFVLVAPATAYLAFFAHRGELVFGSTGLATDALLVASGAITAVPLLCFGQAARKLRLSTLGFLQYLAPSAQFVLAITVLGEQMAVYQWASFALIWVALAVYSLDAVRSLHGSRPLPAVPRTVRLPNPVVSRTD
jgi:chloramphenicol-sensitive protein RarD